MWVLLSKVTFREILLIRVCTVKVRDRMGVEKYLRKSCYHRIKCSAANSLAAFMWRRPLNSAALVVPTHRGPVRVSDGTSTQVVAWTTNKWRAKIIQREIYNVRDPWCREGRNEERKTIAIKNWTCNQLWVKYIRIDLFKLCRWQFSSDWTILFTFSCHLNPF